MKKMHLFILGLLISTAALADSVPKPIQLGEKFKQRVNKVHIYFTHYALFQEPDPLMPAAIYLDGATGAPTNEMALTPPITRRIFTRQGPNSTAHTAPSETSRKLPYVVYPPGFPIEETPAPPSVIAQIVAATKLPQTVVQPNTSVLLVAMGQFLDEGPATAHYSPDGTFEMQKMMRFQVRVRIGFIFMAPPGMGQSVAVLTGMLDMGTVHKLIDLPPPPNPNEIVLYDWKAPMTLSTNNSYVRKTATEPKPVADGFPKDLTEIRFEGARADEYGHYRIVGYAKPADVTFTAPPELEEFLFGTRSLTDVEFAVMEEGHLAPIQSDKP